MHGGSGRVSRENGPPSRLPGSAGSGPACRRWRPSVVTVCTTRPPSLRRVEISPAARSVPVCWLTAPGVIPSCSASSPLVQP